MGPLIKDKGTAREPAFYQSAPTTKAAPKSNAPIILLGVVFVGVMYVALMRSKTIEGPVLTVNPSYDADASLVTNATNSVLAITALRSHAATSDT